MLCIDIEGKKIDRILVDWGVSAKILLKPC